jgi:hypothetical protein
MMAARVYDAMLSVAMVLAVALISAAAVAS